MSLLEKVITEISIETLDVAYFSTENKEARKSYVTSVLLGHWNNTRLWVIFETLRRIAKLQALKKQCLPLNMKTLGALDEQLKYKLFSFTEIWIVVEVNKKDH